MARKIPYVYDECEGNVPTEPVNLVDWFFLGVLTIVAIGLLIFVFASLV